MADTRVKICGLTRAQDAEAAVVAGAAYLGFVFAPSPRQVRADSVVAWLDPLREAAELVGVFRDQAIDFVRRTIEELDLDLVQLHGSEEGSQWLELPVRILAVRTVRGESVSPSRFGGSAWAELLDSDSEQGGGSGRGFDWSVAADEARKHRVFLAGGLDPENVEHAIQELHPFAVDLSSGVESSPGIKDPAKMRAFCEAVRRS